MASNLPVGLDMPDYLSQDLLQKCLEKRLKCSNIQILQIQMTAGSSPGDNYTSIIHRANIKYKYPKLDTTHNISLIIKSHAIEAMRDTFEKFSVVSKEITMYQDLLPKLHELIKPTILSPELYDIFTEPFCSIVFQDMNTLGYKLADREKGLDEAHLQKVLKKTALLHAASMLLLKKEPDIVKKCTEGMLTETSLEEPLMKAVFEDNIRRGAEMVTKIPGYEHFNKKLIKISENFEKIALESVQAEPEKDIQVLLHGDLSVNNLLFVYDEKTSQPTDSVFVDFQVSFFGSLGIDLNYLFATSTTLDILERRMELIEKYYYPTFVDTLQLGGFKEVPTLKRVIEQVKNREILFIIALFGVLPLVSMNRDESKTNDITQFLDESKANQKRAVGMSSQRFIETMKYSLKSLEWALDEALQNY